MAVEPKNFREEKDEQEEYKVLQLSTTLLEYAQNRKVRYQGCFFRKCGEYENDSKNCTARAICHELTFLKQINDEKEEVAVKQISKEDLMEIIQKAYSLENAKTLKGIVLPYILRKLKEFCHNGYFTIDDNLIRVLVDLSCENTKAGNEAFIKISGVLLGVLEVGSEKYYEAALEEGREFAEGIRSITMVENNHNLEQTQKMHAWNERINEAIDEHVRRAELCQSLVL